MNGSADTGIAHIPGSAGSRTAGSVSATAGILPKVIGSAASLGSRNPVRFAQPSLRVVEYDAEAVALASADAADAVAVVHAVWPSLAFHGPLMDGEDDSVTLVELVDFDARLHSRTLLRQHEFGAAKIRIRL